MPTPMDRFASTIRERLAAFEHKQPNLAALKELISIAYLASLKTEEGRHVRASLTFIDPRTRAYRPPTLRADYPAIAKFGKPRPLTVEALVKLARAVDKWSGSIAVHRTSESKLVAWGIVDQLGQINVQRNRESDGGYGHPGTLVLVMDGVGALSAYHDDCFLCALEAEDVVTHEADPLIEYAVVERIVDALDPYAVGMQNLLKLGSDNPPHVEFVRRWGETLARLCIGLRRSRTGGAFLITPKPAMDRVSVGYPFSYRRLGDAMILSVVDDAYLSRVTSERFQAEDNNRLDAKVVRKQDLAENEVRDRQSELAGAIKVTTSLATVDGLVLMNEKLHVLGFGTKIVLGGEIGPVFDGADFVKRKRRARRVDLSHFGTRHTSMLRYCRSDKDAIGLVVSQDGRVRLITSIEGALTLWDRVKLLDHTTFSKEETARWQRYLQRRDEYVKRFPRKRGLTPTPKTLRALARRAVDG